MPQTEGSNEEARTIPSGWSRPLARPVKLRSGPNLVTLADVRSYLFKRMQAHRKDPNWQRVTAMLLSAARSAEVDVTEVTVAVEMAASMDGTPARPGPFSRI
jgi:hypothetical protein